jgi:hypothetical protein
MFVCLEDEEFQERRDEERVVRVAYLWRKVSVPNHPLPMLIYKNICINRNMENIQENSTTTRHMALS